MAPTPADQIVAQLQARGLVVEPASGGPTTQPDDASGIQLNDAGPQIVRITGDDLSITVPRAAEALRNVLSSLDAA